jgi:hypothetical protein
MGKPYRAGDWFWNVTGHPGEVYASRRAAYVSSTLDAEYLEFLADANLTTGPISEADLREVLSNAGVPYLAEALPAIEIARPLGLPRARLRVQAPAFTCPTATPTPVVWTAPGQGADPLGMHQGANPSRIVIAERGVWRYELSAEFVENAGGAGGGTGFRALALTRGLGGAPEVLRRHVMPAAPTAGEVSAFTLVSTTPVLEVGDILRAIVQHSSGGNRTVQGMQLDMLRIQ